MNGAKKGALIVVPKRVPKAPLIRNGFRKPYAGSGLGLNSLSRKLLRSSYA